MILDVGCGSTPKGNVNVDLTLSAEHRGSEFKRLEARRIPNFVLAEAEKLPFRNKTFDVVYSSHVLEHCLNPYLVLKEFRRLAKKRVIIQVPYKRAPNECKQHLYCWDYSTLEHLCSKVFKEQVKIYPCLFLRKLKDKRISFRTLADLFLYFFGWLLWGKQYTAECYV